MNNEEMTITTRANVLAAAWTLIGGSAEEYAYAWWDIGKAIRDIEFKKTSKEEMEQFVEELRERL